MASYSTTSSSAYQSPHPWTYDVFISFRVEDTRRSFSSHLYDALCRKALLTFIDDDELQTAEEIAPSLVQAIQESNVAVVVFSKNYASSTGCLDELVKIIECRQTCGQIVIPIFYEVNPSHIRKQSDDVATAFERHEQNPKNAHKIQNWRDALIITASLSGFDSKDFKKDRILISEIVEVILKKRAKSSVFNGYWKFVGLDSHFQRIKQAISFECQSHPWRYDVFLNFRGQDTRRSFSNHLYDALCQEALLTFIDDDELERGEEIVESLVQAIQESNIAVVVFSKDYASSTWCLDELVKIIECHQTRGQIVIPVFYDVNPSHLRIQSHDVVTAFERHERNPKNAHKIQNWKDAFTMIANLSGLDSKDFRYDHMLISKIVEDISKKVTKSKVVEGLDVCIIGIWGMDGIGKTTIAEFIFARLSFEFERCCFLGNVGKRSKVRDLRKELISQLQGEKIRNVYAFTGTRLGRRRALIVLDGVDDSQQLDSLIGDPCWFGLQSIIIITGRDKQALERRTRFLYEVEPLKDEEALQLFSWSAFKQNNPKNDYESLSSSFIEYAQGNPLALKVLGSFLNGRTTIEWQSVLQTLSVVQNRDIFSVLQIGYDHLHQMEKDMFLDIACFFRGASKDVAMPVLETYGFDAIIIISALVDKCFVTISKNILEMHDLMQEMGKKIVRQKSIGPNKGSRLWTPLDIS